MVPNSVLFFSDSEETINLYRLPLINKLECRGWKVGKSWISRIGFDFLEIYRAKLVVSSNMRANLVCLLFFQKNRVIILNGLGNLRRSRLLLRLFLLLIYVNRNHISLIAQNYRDFRWLRKKDVRVKYIMGSGGESLPVGPFSSYSNWAVITRDSKFEKQKQYITSFIESVKPSNLKIYGLSGKKDVSNYSAVSVGFVEPSEFFMNSNSYFHAGGYSEGFPHSLAYAICSDCLIAVDRKQWIEFGLFRFDISYEVKGMFFLFRPTQVLKDVVSSENVVIDYIEEINYRCQLL